MESLRRAIRRLLKGRQPPPVLVEISQPQDILPYLYWIEDRPIRFLLPTSMLRMQGGFTYGPDHPFVKCLKSGTESLTRFYADFQPTNIAEMYDIPKKGSQGEGLPPWELPWVMRENRSPPPSEAGLSIEHGISFYGPASRKKVSIEYQRLSNVLKSIREHGYQPDMYGDIEGHFMQLDKKICFFVRGGKHRAAVLSYLEHSQTPVRIRRTWPSLVAARDAESWPLVAEGQIHIDVARQILAAIVRGR